MGTKRHLAGEVNALISSLNPEAAVVDLFSGMGSVAETFADRSPVVLNDALEFASGFARARFLGHKRPIQPDVIWDALKPSFEKQLENLKVIFERELYSESYALQASLSSLQKHFREFTHVGNSRLLSARAKAAAKVDGTDHYCMVSLYFSGGYFSLAQAIEIDAIRFSIDQNSTVETTDWLLSAWIRSASRIINSTGHTAQFLKPTTEVTAPRVRKTMTRSFVAEFQKSLSQVPQIGSEDWRDANEVYSGDAFNLLENARLENASVIYADPPYTKDQYSRFYHVFETMYKYNFPDSLGAGRTPTNRFNTGFSLKSQVVASFHDLCRLASMRSIPLIISYPANGLLSSTGWSVDAIGNKYFSSVTSNTYDMNHSTMGASKGVSKKPIKEQIYVCKP